MPRALDLTERQVRAILRAAAKEGHVPEIVIGKTTLRLVPDIHDGRPQAVGRIDATPEPETFESLDDYFAWRDRNRDRENQGNS